MSLRSDLLEAYRKAKEEDQHSDLQRDLRGLIKRNFPQMDVNPLILEIDKSVTGHTQRLVERQSTQRIMNVDSLFDAHKKKLKKAGKRISVNNAIVAVETIPKVEVLPETEIKKEAVVDEMLKAQDKERLSLSDEDLISKFGSLSALRSYGKEVLGLDLNRNSRKGATVAAVKEALAARLSNGKDEEE